VDVANNGPFQLTARFKSGREQAAASRYLFGTPWRRRTAQKGTPLAPCGRIGSVIR
jgi:hypothetical protein